MESVTVRLSADPERTLTIPLTATGSSGATASDFSVPASVTFTSGETEKTVTFTATHDTEDDDGESVLLAFGTLPTAVTPGGLTQTTVNITDDDDPEVNVSFAAAAYTVAEGGMVTVTVRLSADPERTVDIPLTATAQGGATAPGGTDPDYVAPPATVTFDTGQTERTFTFSTTQDFDDDDGENVLLEFGTLLPDRVIAGAAATVNITDDDGPGVNLSPLNLNVVQGRSATYRVTLNTRPTVDVTVTPASDNPDVTFEPATLTFMPAAWNSAQSVTVSAPAGSAGQSATISHSATSADAAYEGITIPSVTVTVTVAPPPSSGGGGGGGGFGPALEAPSFVDGFRVSRPLAVNARPGDVVGDPVAATHPNDDDVTYSLSGADASLFTVDAETGQIRLGQAVTLELGQTYTVNLTATDSTGTGAIIIVDIAVAEAAFHRYDLNRNGSIEKDEVIAAITDYFVGLIEKDVVLEVVAAYFA